MWFPSFLPARRLPRPLVRHVQRFRVERDLDTLLARMRRRWYPETIPVLASFWLKTVFIKGYGRRQWRQLNRLLQRALAGQPLDIFSRQALIDIQSWIQQNILRAEHPPQAPQPRGDGARLSLDSDYLAPYLGRLLNEWLPAEVARLLVQQEVPAFPQDEAVPVLAIGKALEGLLVRERLSPATLEMLLQPDRLSPRLVYARDVEMLQDVVLALLGQTSARSLPVLPVALLGVASGALLPADFRQAVDHAVLVRLPGAERIHVPITPAQALDILRDEPVRIGSVLVSLDGRWWESETLQSGEQHSVVYRPMGRLRLDDSADHLRLRIPWPGPRLTGSGEVSFPGAFQLFGREWRVAQWEEDAERAWLRLVFTRVVPVAEKNPQAFPRLRPASVDMAWAALENALAASLAQKSTEPIERLRHTDLIPIGRAIVGLSASLTSPRPQLYEAVETRLQGLRYLEAPVVPVYGRVPWRILPPPVRAAFSRVRAYPGLLEHMQELFDALPGRLTAPAPPSRPGDTASSRSKAHAA